MTNNELRNEVNEAYIAHIRAHREENRKGMAAMREDLLHSTLFNGERVISAPLGIPKVFSEEDIERFRYATETTHSICCKMIRHYIDDPAYRAAFPYSKECEELILTDAGYESLLPMARFDIFYNEETGDYKFCEINTDGTSAMNEDYVLDKAYFHSPAHQAVIREYTFENFDLFTPWIETFLRLYDTWKDPRGLAPHTINIAITDFMDRGVVREFEEFARRFQKAGVFCQVVDARDMVYKDGLLYSPEGWVIDAIYRRAVTGDVLRRLDSCPDFLQAVKDGRVFLCGAFRSQVVHTKWTFLAMHLAETKRFLTEEESAFIDAHIPLTVDLSEDGITASSTGISKEDVLANKDAYIIKPYDDFGSFGVTAGITVSQNEWEAAVNAAYGKGFICQEYCTQYATTNIDLSEEAGTDAADFRPFINMSGLYCYDGKFTGIFSRQSPGGIIASHHNELDVPTYVVTGRR